MIATRFIGVAQDINVTIRHLVLEAVEYGSDGKTAAACVDRQSVGLRHDVALGIADKAREVVRLAKQRAACCAHHHPPHLSRNMIELFLDQGKTDRIVNHPTTPAAVAT